ncbi:GNAT family N-acetyltransferase [Scleromatobacter humisilvae]|uniref:L-ornithine N(alpha)-acyltransferase n=1 Tax=Scleromatobacter humisilvae TaxID=2897159 RepID=A0A9X1YKS9_9BURK|nr:GNAT family N-acyltransferase [Scleromatobacter humisilvae]MCK9687776.1 GNAT family N-acetyltransferase [Scleromatobacter humisilvae]
MTEFVNTPGLAAGGQLDSLRRPDRPAGRAQRSHVAPTLQVVWARQLDDVRAAQRLRHQVFVEEMGAQPTPVPGAPAGHDIDLFDEFCEHLIVRTAPANDELGEVVGTYRVLTPSAARRAGSFYSDTEFDLTQLRPLRERMVELGRSCVHRDHRSGTVILALWGALAQFMEHNAMETVIGCASISMRDGGHCAASLWASLRETHLAPVEWQVRPRVALPVDDLNQGLDVEAPALIKGYLRMGAKVLGAPAWDPEFNTADLPMLTRVADIPARYRRHFLG